MREREGGGRRERKKFYCNGWIHVNEFKKKEQKRTHMHLVCLPFRKT